MRRIFILILLLLPLCAPGRVHANSLYQFTKVLPFTSADSPLQKSIGITQFIIAHDRLLSLADSTRLYTYTTSLYADVFTSSGDEHQALTATLIFLNRRYPTFEPLLQETLQTGSLSVQSLAETSLDILEEYEDRFHTDGSQYTWNQKTPDYSSTWYRRRGLPESPVAPHWKTWIIPKETLFLLPDPAQYMNVHKNSETAQLLYHTRFHDDQDIQHAYLWHGGVSKRSPTNTHISASGIWINAFVLNADTLTNEETSTHLKNLTQIMSDAVIACWHMKYLYWSRRPSMDISSLSQSIADPESPSYPSGLSCVSAAASTYLQNVLPQYSDVWTSLVNSTLSSQIAAGIAWPVDTAAGHQMGKQVAVSARSVLQEEHVDNLIAIDLESKRSMIGLTYIYKVRTFIDAALSKLLPKPDAEHIATRYMQNIKHDPTDSRPYIDLIDHYRNDGQIERSREVLRQYIDRFPEDIYPLIILGNDLRQHSQTHEEAERVLLQAVKLDPYHDWSWEQLGKLYLEQERLDEAERALRHAVTLQPTNYGQTGAYAYLVDLYIRQNRLSDAIELYKSIITHDPDPQIYIQLATLYEQEDLQTLAYDIYDEALIAFPRSEELRAAIPQEYIQSREAEKLLQRVEKNTKDIVK